MSTFKGDVLRKENGVWRRKGSLLGDGPIPLGVDYLPTMQATLEIESTADLDPTVLYPASVAYAAKNIGLWTWKNGYFQSVVPGWVELPRVNAPSLYHPWWTTFGVVQDVTHTITPPAGITLPHKGPSRRVPPDGSIRDISRSMGLNQFPVSNGRCGLSTVSGGWQEFPYGSGTPPKTVWLWIVNGLYNEPLAACTGFSTSMWVWLADDKAFRSAGPTHLLRKARDYNSSYFPDTNPTFDLSFDGTAGTLTATVLCSDGQRRTASADQVAVPIAEWTLISVDWSGEYLTLLINGEEVGQSYPAAGSVYSIAWTRKKYTVLPEGYQITGERPYGNICPDPWTIGIRHGWGCDPYGDQNHFNSGNIAGGAFDGFIGALWMDQVCRDQDHYRALYHQVSQRY